MTKAQTAATKYLEHGYSPIPLVSGQKRPLGILFTALASALLVVAAGAHRL
jgi:hypothetical protein